MLVYQITDDFEKKKNFKIFLILFLDKNRQGTSSKRKNYQNKLLSRIQSGLVICHPPWLYLDPSVSNEIRFEDFENEKIFSFFCVTFSPKQNLNKAFITISREIIIRVPSKLNHWSSEIFLFHIPDGLEKVKFWSFAHGTKWITYSQPNLKKTFKKNFREPRVISSVATHHHSSCIHIYRMSPNSKISKPKKFSGVGRIPLVLKIWAQTFNNQISRNMHQTIMRAGSLTLWALILAYDMWFWMMK